MKEQLVIHKNITYIKKNLYTIIHLVSRCNSQLTTHNSLHFWSLCFVAQRRVPFHRGKLAFEVANPFDEWLQLRAGRGRRPFFWKHQSRQEKRESDIFIHNYMICIYVHIYIYTCKMIWKNISSCHIISMTLNLDFKKPLKGYVRLFGRRYIRHSLHGSEILDKGTSVLLWSS